MVIHDIVERELYTENTSSQPKSCGRNMGDHRRRKCQVGRISPTNQSAVLFNETILLDYFIYIVQDIAIA